MAARKSKKISDAQNLVSTMTVQDFGMQEAPKQIDEAGFALWIRQLKQNWRQGTVGCKGRSEVSYANRKPWKQKGTGRARAGSARSPLWRGGGITFGPQPRTRTLKVGKALKQGILGNLFWEYLNQGKVQCLDWALDNQTPKTSLAYNALRNIDALNVKVNIFLSAHDLMHYASFTNIKNVRIVFFDEMNAYDLASADRWILLKKDMDAFKETVAQWI